MTTRGQGCSHQLFLSVATYSEEPLTVCCAGLLDYKPTSDCSSITPSARRTGRDLLPDGTSTQQRVGVSTVDPHGPHYLKWPRWNQEFQGSLRRFGEIGRGSDRQRAVGAERLHSTRCRSWQGPTDALSIIKHPPRCWRGNHCIQNLGGTVEREHVSPSQPLSPLLFCSTSHTLLSTHQ